MLFFSSSIWDHWRIFRTMNVFANVWWLTNIRCVFFSSRWDHWRISFMIITFVNVLSLTNSGCPFSLHRNFIIEEFLLGWTHWRMFDDWFTSDVLFLFIGVRSLENFCHHYHFREYCIIDQRPISFFFLSRWDDVKISLTMNPFANGLWLTNGGCPFCPRRDEIIEEFLSLCSPSPMFYHWPTSDLVFVVIEMRWLKNFTDYAHIRRCFIIEKRRISFFVSSRWGNWGIFRSII